MSAGAIRQPRHVLGTAEAAKGYSLIRALDNLADKLAQQPQVLVQRAHATRPHHRPAQPSLAAATTVTAPAPSGAPPLPGDDGEDFVLEDAMLHNTNQFYKWISELEAARTSESERKYETYASILRGHLEASSHVEDRIDAILLLCSALKEDHASVKGKTADLRASCERMVRDKQTLVEFADALRNKLRHFEELDSLSAEIARVRAHPEGDGFVPLLQRLDDCTAYMANTLAQHAEVDSYVLKVKQLQVQAMAAIHQRVAAVLRRAYDQSVEAARQHGGRGGVAAVLAAVPAADEPAVLVVQFRAVMEAGARGLLEGLQARSQRQEYAHTLNTCVTMYRDVRSQLLTPVVQARCREFAAQPLPSLVRSGCAYLIQVCHLEHQLFDSLFPSLSADPGALAPLAEPLCLLLYDHVRPKVVGLQGLVPLCEVVDILQGEVLQEQLTRRGEAAAPLRPLIKRMTADVQGRLAFKGQALIRDAVLHYKPTAADLDYPTTLQQQAANVPPPVEGDEPSTPPSPTTAQWYPPVHNALECLSKLYLVLDSAVFGGLAQDAVLAAATAIQNASRTIAKQASLMDGYLFQIKQLLILREQLAPFTATFQHTEKALDLSYMRDHLRRIVAGQASLFSLSMDNALVQFVRQGSLVRENQVDAKQQLDGQLKETCERFIVAVTKVVVEPLLSLITVVTAVRMPGADAEGALPPLREQAFASVERLTEVVGKVNAALRDDLPPLVTKMRLYLPDPATQAILFKPIKSNIAEAHAQLAALLEAEYSPEEAAAVGLMDPRGLGGVLDALG